MGHLFEWTKGLDTFDERFRFIYYYPEYDTIVLQSYKSNPEIDEKYGCFYIGEL